MSRTSITSNRGGTVTIGEKVNDGYDHVYISVSNGARVVIAILNDSDMRELQYEIERTLHHRDTRKFLKMMSN